ncbi:MAG: putative 3-dehydroquinate synthase [Myxococcales bacterium]|nr:putative 3-dehydroquinate synthase [Myxococcales bacterium]
MSARLLVTGGQGFVGRHVVAEWLRRHSDGRVLALGRSPRNDRTLPHRVHRAGQPIAAPVPAGLRELLDDRYEYLSVDLTDTQSLTRIVGTFQPDVVIHLAAALRDEPLDRLLAVNVNGVASVLSAVVGSGVTPRAIVLGSSGAVYGVPAALPIAEDAACAPLDQYGVSKQAGEAVSRLIATRHALPVIVARIFNPVGPGQDERHLTSWVAMQATEVAAGRRSRIEVGPLDTTRDFIDVRDVAAALALLAAEGAPGTTYNVASGTETKTSDVLSEGLRAAGLTQEVPIARRSARPSDIPRHFADTRRLRALGFQPVHSLAKSMDAVVGYYRGDVAGAEDDETDRAPTMTVTATATHRYVVEVEAGLLKAVPERLATLFPGAHLVMLTDQRVHELYGARLLDGLRRVDANASAIFIGEGEPAKSLDSHQRLLGELHRARFDRRAVLVNLGGGVVIDTGGFVAATYMRGVAYVNVPTTLLAQHDAAVGGKVAVNTSAAKNFVGAFHHPRAVFSDPATLGTLEDRHISAGIAEAIKVAICGDEELFCILEREVAAIRQWRDARVLGEVVRRATSKKIELLAPDPYEHDLRRALNLGHSFGHPLETELEYTGILHGEAVGFGLAVAVEVARARGVCPDEAAERIIGLLAAYGLPPKVPRSRLRAACVRMAEIRLVRGRALHFVLPSGVAHVEIVAQVSDDEIGRAIDAVAWHPLIGACVVEDVPAEQIAC